VWKSRVGAARSSPILQPAGGRSGPLRTCTRAHGFDLPNDLKLPESGVRRAVCAATEARVDVSDSDVSDRLLRVYVDAIYDWGRGHDVFGPQANEDPLVAEARTLVRLCARFRTMALPSTTKPKSSSGQH